MRGHPAPRPGTQDPPRAERIPEVCELDRLALLKHAWTLNHVKSVWALVLIMLIPLYYVPLGSRYFMLYRSKTVEKELYLLTLFSWSLNKQLFRKLFRISYCNLFCAITAQAGGKR